MNYKIKLFTEIDEELNETWLNFEKDSNYICFNSLVWIKNYISSYKEFRNNYKLRIFIISLQGKPICILPFEILRKFKTNILLWACDLKSDFNAPIQKKNFSFEKKSFEEIWNKILKMMPEVDVIYLKKQINFFEISNNPFVNFLKNSKEGIIQQIYLPKKWDSYINKILKKKFYLDLMRTRRLIKKSGKVEFVIARNHEEKNFFLENLIKQKKKNLKRIKKNLLSNEDLDFYKNFEKYENKQYDTQVSAIKLNGEFVAMHWGIFDKNRYYYLLPAMKEENLKKFAPGKLLLYLLIRWSISKRLKFFDFGLGEELYKKKWSNKKVSIYNYIKINKIKGIFIYTILKVRQTIRYFTK